MNESGGPWLWACGEPATGECCCGGWTVDVFGVSKKKSRRFHFQSFCFSFNLGIGKLACGWVIGLCIFGLCIFGLGFRNLNSWAWAE